MKNQKEIPGKYPHHFNMRLFYVTSVIGCRNVTIKYYLPKNMITDGMLKLLIKHEFEMF